MKSNYNSRLILFQIILIIFLLFNIRLFSEPANDDLLINKFIHTIPFYKIYVYIEFNDNLTLKNFSELTSKYLIVEKKNISDIVKNKNGLFKIKLQNYNSIISNKFIKSIKPIFNYTEEGIYQIHFRVKEKINEPIEFKITLPRDSSGKKILNLNYKINLKPVEEKIIKDEAENNWLIVSYSNINSNQELKFDAVFEYNVDLNKLINSSFFLLDDKINIEYTDDSIILKKYLSEGNKICYSDKRIIELSDEINKKTNSIKKSVDYVKKFIKKNIKYDFKKKRDYFGGKMIYIQMDDMYQSTVQTLNRKIGACPDEAEIETAILRKLGIPARTAGRYQHFYAQIYVPEKGWIDTSLAQEQILLFISPDNNDYPFVNWNKKIKVQTTKWYGKLKIKNCE